MKRRGVEKVLTILKGRKKFPPFKREEEQKVLPCLEGGGRKKVRTRDSPILYPPPHCP